jgi:hypothetical protein
VRQRVISLRRFPSGSWWAMIERLQFLTQCLPVLVYYCSVGWLVCYYCSQVLTLLMQLAVIQVLFVPCLTCFLLVRFDQLPSQPNIACLVSCLHRPFTDNSLFLSAPFQIRPF